MFIIADSAFHVTVTSNTTGPVPLGSVVKLHCSISPNPSIGRPVQLKYRWTQHSERWSSASASPSVTLHIGVTHYEASFYFCAIAINQHIIGVSSIVIRMKGNGYI